MSEALVNVQLASSFTMVGVIWMVQLVNYPLMRAVPATSFVDYEDGHRRRISLVVGPAMALELIAAVGLVVYRPSDVPAALALGGLGLLILALGVTAFVSAPIHGRLLEGRSDELIDRLVTTNWVRTAAWTGRGAVAFAMLQLTLR